MEDKRRRARVQGAWAGAAKSQVTAQPGKDLWGSPVFVCLCVDQYRSLLIDVKV